MTDDVRDYITTIPDFPKPGIMFRDVTTLFGDPRGFRMAVDRLAAPFMGKGVDHVAGLEARGFVLGGAVAHQLGAGFTSMRKPGKLPRDVISEDYELEYGTATLQVHADAIAPGDTVLIVDDLIATGGTAAAAVRLTERLGGVLIGAAFVIDLPDLGGMDRLRAMGVETHRLCAFEGH